MTVERSFGKPIPLAGDFGASCVSKRRYATKIDALRAYGTRNYRKPNAYACRFCRGWHIGNHLTATRRILHKSTVRVLKREEREMMNASHWESAA
jgi:hypothetical protein